MVSKTRFGINLQFHFARTRGGIALAGVTGNVRLFQLLAKLGGSRAVAFCVLFAWLAGNLFLAASFVDFAPVHRLADAASGICPSDRLSWEFL